MKEMMEEEKQQKLQELAKLEEEMAEKAKQDGLMLGPEEFNVNLLVDQDTERKSKPKNKKKKQQRDKSIRSPSRDSPSKINNLVRDAIHNLDPLLNSAGPQRAKTQYRRKKSPQFGNPGDEIAQDQQSLATFVETKFNQKGSYPATEESQRIQALVDGLGYVDEREPDDTGMNETERRGEQPKDCNFTGSSEESEEEGDKQMSKSPRVQQPRTSFKQVDKNEVSQGKQKSKSPRVQQPNRQDKRNEVSQLGLKKMSTQ